MAEASSDDVYLRSHQVRERYGRCSDMWIFRRTRDDGFPKPTCFGDGRLRYWKLSDLDQWDREQAAKRAEPRT